MRLHVSEDCQYLIIDSCTTQEYEQLKVLSQNGDVIIIDLSPINLNVSLINKDFLKGNINNKIVLDYEGAVEV